MPKIFDRQFQIMQICLKLYMIPHDEKDFSAKEAL